MQGKFTKDNNVKHALWVTIVAQFLSKLGDALASPKTVLPWVLGAMGAPVFMVGLLVPLRESMSMVPQVLLSGVVARAERYYVIWCTASVAQGVFVILIGITAFVLEGAAGGWVLITLLLFFSLCRCLASIASKLVLAKTIPKTLRGQTTGISASAAGIIAIVLGILFYNGVFSPASGAPGVGILAGVLVVAGICWMTAAYVFAFVPESRSSTKETAAASDTFFKRYKPLLGDNTFRRFVIARALFLTTALSAPYYILLATQEADASFEMLGLFILASGMASLVVGPIWGVLSDWSSRRVMILAAVGAGGTGLVVFGLRFSQSTVLHSLWLLPSLYFLLELFYQGVRIGRKTYIVDAAPKEQRVAYVTASNTLIGILLLFIGATNAVVGNVSAHWIILVFSLLSLFGCYFAWRLPEVEMLAKEG